MARVGNGRVWLAGMALTLAVVPAAVGCTASVDPSADPGVDPYAAPVVPRPVGSRTSATASPQGVQSGDLAVDPRRGTGAVTVAVPQGAPLPDEFERDFLSTTGFSLTQVEVPDLAAAEGSTDRPFDVVVGLDATDATDPGSSSSLSPTAPEDAQTLAGTELAGAPAAVAFARNDVCVLADLQWFGANNLDVPTALDDLTDPAVAPLLVVPDPASTTAGRAFVQATAVAAGDGAASWWSALLERGAAVDSWEQAKVSWTATSSAGTRPLLVAPASLAATTLNNSGTESAAAAVDATCLDRPLYAAITASPANADGAEALVAYLLTGDAQRLLAESAWATPLAPDAAQDTAIGWFSAPSEDAVIVSEDDLAHTGEWLDTWTGVLSSR